MKKKKSNRKSIDEYFQNKLDEVFDRLYTASFANASDEVKAFLAFDELKEPEKDASYEAFLALSKKAQEEYLDIQVQRLFHAFSFVEYCFVSLKLISETECSTNQSDLIKNYVKKNLKFLSQNNLDVEKI
jgi:hypothetical protein